MMRFLTFPVAVLLGFLAGLGVGGGSLLMLWLTVVIGMEYADARTIDLLFFLPTALISTCFRWKQGSVRLKKILPAIICGCIAAGIFAVVGKYMQTELIKKCFGGLLIFTGLREIFYRPQNAR